MKLVMKEVDTDRLTRRGAYPVKCQNNLLIQVRASHWHLVMVSPPCSTFSRVRSANPDGLPPLRSHKFVRGYPWLSKKAKAQVKKSNWAVGFCGENIEKTSGKWHGTPHSPGTP